MNSDHDPVSRYVNLSGKKGGGMTRRELLVISARSFAGLTLMPLSQVLADGLVNPSRII